MNPADNNKAPAPQTVAEPQQQQEQQVAVEQAAEAPQQQQQPQSVGKGECPIKAEYRTTGPLRVTLDEEGRTRGMNKGVARKHSELAEGTQRPTLEGEMNFMTFETLKRVKEAIRTSKQWGGGKGKGGNKNSSSSNQQPGSKRPREEEAGAEAEAAAAPAEAAPPADGAPVTEKTAVPAPVPASKPQPATTTTTTTATATATATTTPIEPTEAPPGTNDATKDSSLLLPKISTQERLRELIERNREKTRGIFTDKLVLAPLTTVGNLPFRRICKSYGADITISEMAVAYNLNRMQKSEWALLRRHESEDIFGIQVAVGGRGNEPTIFAQALEDSGFAYDFLDINCGCPVDKIMQYGCGCALGERKPRLREVTENLVLHQSRPVAIKCRIGPDEAAPTLHRNISEFASWGACVVTVHGRSRKQRYTKLANWDYVDHCATLTDLPVIGNGDILALEDVQQHRLEQPHISSFMIGRGALVKPWIFDEIKSGQVQDISSSERLDMLKEFCRCGLAHWGADERGVMTTRRFLCEWLSYLCRYVPVALLERLPQRMNERPPWYQGRDDLETLMASDNAADWIRISEILLGPVEEKFVFTPKHKSNSYTTADSVEAVEG